MTPEQFECLRRDLRETARTTISAEVRTALVEAGVIPDLVGHKQAAELLGVSPSTLKRYREDGRVEPVAGSNVRRPRYSRREILRAVEAGLMVRPTAKCRGRA